MAPLLDRIAIYVFFALSLLIFSSPITLTILSYSLFSKKITKKIYLWPVLILSFIVGITLILILLGFLSRFGNLIS